ncbi:RDD family protein [Enemella sp. A6]|uniref:RDD family protein n=1 Tax=Enemella sp. A6 TaxID=3440152 RepID=UPI003EC13678
MASKQQSRVPGPGDPDYVPGSRLGLPDDGPGSLASWWSRIAALVIDWASSMALAVALFGGEVVTGGGWQRWMTLTVFFVQTVVMTGLTGSSLGHWLARIGVARLDGQPLGLLRAIPRAFLICLAIPPLVVDGDRRGLHDLLLGTVVVYRR